MTQPNNNRGGKRAGSGRKKLGEGKKQRITFTLADDVIDFLKANRPAAQTLEKAIREYAQNLEKAAAAVDEFGIAWNTQQKTARLQREIEHFNAQIERYKNAASPREKSVLTLSKRKLTERQKMLDALTL